MNPVTGKLRVCWLTQAAICGVLMLVPYSGPPRLPGTSASIDECGARDAGEAAQQRRVPALHVLASTTSSSSAWICSMALTLRRHGSRCRPSAERYLVLRRQSSLRRMLPCLRVVIVGAWPGIWANASCRAPGRGIGTRWLTRWSPCVFGVAGEVEAPDRRAWPAVPARARLPGRAPDGLLLVRRKRPLLTMTVLMAVAIARLGGASPRRSGPSGFTEPGGAAVLHPRGELFTGCVRIPARSAPGTSPAAGRGGGPRSGSSRPASRFPARSPSSLFSSSARPPWAAGWSAAASGSSRSSPGSGGSSTSSGPCEPGPRWRPSACG